MTLTVVSADELERIEDTGRDWNAWTLDPDLQTLDLWRTHDNGRRGHVRQVDLEQCTTSAKVLDTVVQINNKQWATPDITAGLLNAITDVLHPQSTLCSFGRSGKLTKAEVRQRCRDAGNRWPAKVHPAPDAVPW